MNSMDLQNIYQHLNQHKVPVIDGCYWFTVEADGHWNAISVPSAVEGSEHRECGNNKFSTSAPHPQLKRQKRRNRYRGWQ